MNDTELEKLKEHVNKLKSLLDDPHPGISSWISAYVCQMKFIADFWNND